MVMSLISSMPWTWHTVRMIYSNLFGGIIVNIYSNRYNIIGFFQNGKYFLPKFFGTSIFLNL